MRYSTALQAAQKQLRVVFTDEELLFNALSQTVYYVNDYRTNKQFDRLELRGDAILKLLALDNIMERELGFNKEFMPELAALTGNWWLGVTGLNIGLLDLQIGDPAERRITGQSALKRCADIIEALLAAIYLDQGMESARHFAETVIFPGMLRLIHPYRAEPIRDQFHRELGCTPEYKEVGTFSALGRAVHIVALCSEGKELGRGYGGNKAQASEEAARNLLRSFLGHDHW